MKYVNMVLITVLITLLTSCQIFQLSEVNKALNNMEKLDSYRMDITLNLDSVSNNLYALVRDDYTEMYYEELTLFFFQKDDGVYTATSDDYGLVQLEKNEELSGDGSYDDFGIYNNFDFELVDGYYVFNGGEMDGIDDLTTTKIRLENDLVREIIIDGFLGGSPLRTSILFSEYDEIDLDVPEFPTIQELATLESYMESLGVTDGGSSSGRPIFSGPFSFDCINDRGSCYFNTNPQLEYDLNNKMISPYNSEDWWDCKTYLVDYPTEDLSEDFLEFLDYYYSLYQKYNISE